ncbi:MAG: cysteine--tRNA ligase [Candidatus Paracaedimonas acanthamoebae]|mgnify:FL=1|uniref:Cysteine--tRNA ligase n=1 Tax=Candidatus Paracaedimonas acanthamoebae TaxID=244581 RepID=A0A8J7Q1B0_9PROT|nr:cysteine--tRNA ligase [Candidatus Paracaedimonas acanthamoebae]
MLKLYNTLTRQLEPFTSLHPHKVGLYVCGPTVYDRAHLGNARPYTIFDVLVRLLRTTHDVTYVRNITDIDDKIINTSLQTGESIETITRKTTLFFHEDMTALGNLSPTIEPKATEHVNEMIEMIEQLLQKELAYAQDGHVLFHVPNFPNYGALSGCKCEEIIAGARIEVAPYKKDPTDFVLWKPSTPEQPGWESPWGRGRPGWHIECSAMSFKHLGTHFDIHGGGQDLIFPHHENEIAQSTAVHGNGTFARYWMHNGILLVNGEKMSKSLGNFITIQDLLNQARGEIIRFALLSTHYRQPLDWTNDTLMQAKASLNRLYTALEGFEGENLLEADQDVLRALQDDLNTPLAIARLHELAREANKMEKGQAKEEIQARLKASASFLGFLQCSSVAWFKSDCPQGLNSEAIDELIMQRHTARRAKDFQKADQIRLILEENGILLLDSAEGTSWRRK